MPVATRPETHAFQPHTSGRSACPPIHPPAGGFDLERVVQLLDDLDDVVACVNQAWLAVAWRGAGIAGRLGVVLAAALPG
jgi:hypothetical protein